MNICQRDSGSATGNRPTCSERATHRVTAWYGSEDLCRSHAGIALYMQDGHATVVELAR